MSKYKNVLENIFSKAVESLDKTHKKPPSKEALRLYRDV
jgi:hypothetical protein